MWLPDSKHLIFVRRPGLPFGQQAQAGGGGIGMPGGPPPRRPPRRQRARRPAGRSGRRRGTRGSGRRAYGGQGAPAGTAPAVNNNSPGLMQATFKGGYTLAFYKADVTTGDAQETWHNQPNDTLVATSGTRASRAISSSSRIRMAADAAAEAAEADSEPEAEPARLPAARPSLGGKARRPAANQPLRGRMGSLLRAQRHGCRPRAPCC